MPSLFAGRASHRRTCPFGINHKHGQIHAVKLVRDHKRHIFAAARCAVGKSVGLQIKKQRSSCMQTRAKKNAACIILAVSFVIFGRCKTCCAVMIRGDHCAAAYQPVQQDARRVPYHRKPYTCAREKLRRVDGDFYQ